MDPEDTGSVSLHQTAAKPLNLGKPCLVEMIGDTPGRVHFLLPGLIIGRDPAAGISLASHDVSRRHVQFRIDGPSVEVSDLGSRNGTVVNGVRVTSSRLAPGDKVRVGNTVFVLAYRDEVSDQVEHAGKLQTIGQLASRVTHDLNNVFTALMNNLFFMDTLPGETAIADPEVRECLTEMQAAVKRAADLGGQLLGLAHAGTGESGAVDVADMVDEVLRLVRRTVPHAISVEVESEEGLRVSGDRGQLVQIFMNLCINARDAMPNGGTLQIACTNRVLDSVRAEVLRVRPGDFVQITVRDTGTGMDDETRRRIFEPFFTTKPKGEGTGLGLATVSEFVRQHGGALELASTLGEGSTFYVLLPRNPVGATTPHITTQKVMPPGDDRVVLLVDHDRALRSSVRRALQRLGMTVLEAARGSDAISRLDARPGEIDLILVDVDLADMSAEEMLARLSDREAAPAMVVLSPPGEDARGEALIQAGALGVVPKPFEPDAICAFLS